jgi:hypothetical protein
MNQNEIARLCCVAEGKRHWFRRPNLEQQLQAIDKLSRSCDRKSLTFLEWLYAETIVVHEIGEAAGMGGDSWLDLRDDECHTFPNAKGPLADELNFDVIVITQGSWSGKGEPRSEEEVEKQRTEYVTNSIGHRTIRAAIQRLQESTVSH